MAKGGSEAAVRAALEDGDDGTLVYKPGDDSRNWKPADFIVWHRLFVDHDRPGSAFIEVKSTDLLGRWSPADRRRGLRPSQRVYAAAAVDMGIVYLVVIYWRRRRCWTISSVRPFLAEPERSFTFEELMSTHGIRAWPQHLGSTIRLALAGELGL